MLNTIKGSNIEIPLSKIRESLTPDERAEFAKALTAEDEEDSGYTTNSDYYHVGLEAVTYALNGCSFRELSSANSKGGERIAYDKLHSPLFLRVECAWHKHRVKGWKWKSGQEFYRIDNDGVFLTGGCFIQIIHKFPRSEKGQSAANAFLAEIGKDDYIKYCELKTNRP